ncbi:MAG TPA: RecQ family ATP-dependent DNA helicase, partial [Anaerolineae bacterium]|nr:RecQ family ATP-dependent DNA helicase [Anaerolineae bacterium]
LPALLRDGTTLVFSPLKALMKDQVDRLLDRGLALADRVDSSQTAEEQERVFQRMREGTVRLVYVAPERVRDPRLMAALKEAKNIVQVVVDEAHCVHMWGHSFRPDFLYISRLVDAIAETRGRRPPVAALTATATPHVRESIARRLGLREGYVEIDRNPNRPELRFVVYNRTSPGFQVRSKRDKLRILLRILRHADRNDESALVYVNTTREAERLARRLEAMGLDVRYYHGKMDDQARKDVQDMFLDGQIKIIVATKAFGMGIDKPDIRYVVHYQIPGDIESYFQEAGRAGRDGRVSWCVLLYHEGDLWIHENYFIPKSLPEPEQVENVLDWIRRRCEAAGWSEIYVDPREMADALGFDEDRELGIHLHLLEELGFIHRDIDVTLKASARLLAPLEAVTAQARELAPGPVGEAIGQVLAEQGIGPVARGELRLVEGALSKGVSPAALDDVFYRLALRGSLIYRAFARAFTLAPGPAMLAGAPLDLDTGEIRRVREEMEANLAAMKRYAESLGVGDCLREEILRYLGAEKPPTRADCCCSLCDVNLPVPWADEPLWEDLTDPGRYQEYIDQVLAPSGMGVEGFRKAMEGALLYDRLWDLITADVPTITEQVEIRYIVFQSEEAATEVADRLDQGEDWESIAQELESQEGSEARVVEPLWRPRSFLAKQFDPASAEIIFSMEPGEHTRPILGLGGQYYVVQVLSHEERELDPMMVLYEREQAFQEWMQQQMERIEYADNWMEKIPTPPTP